MWPGNPRAKTLEGFLLSRVAHDARYLGRYWGQSGHALLHCICLLMTQSGHCDDPVSLIMEAITSAGSLSPNRGMRTFGWVIRTKSGLYGSATTFPEG